MNRIRLILLFRILAIFLLAGSANGIANANASSSDTLLVLNDPLNQFTLGKVTGGAFLAQGGWKVSNPASMIFYDLGTYIKNGSLEISVTNFDPKIENTFKRHHVLSMYTNQWGEHHQIELLDTDWNFHTGFNYFNGIKLQSATYEDNKQVILPENSLKWNINQKYRLKFSWQSDTVRFYRNDTLLIITGHPQEFLLRYIFLGRDRTISGDYFTDYNHQQYPAMVGPVFSNLIVKKIIVGSAVIPPKIESFMLASRYANAVRLKWELSSKGISRLIYRPVGSIKWDSTAIFGPPHRFFEYTIDGLNPAENYEARVILINDDGSTNVGSSLYFKTRSSEIYLLKPRQDSFTEDVGIIGPYRNIANMGWLYLMTGKGRKTFLWFPSFSNGELPRGVSLRLHIRNERGNISNICVRKVYSPWDENSITWESQPQTEDSCLAEFNGELLLPGTWLTLPLHLGASADSALDLAITSRDTGWGSFDSRESLANQPELILDYRKDHRIMITILSPSPNYKTSNPVLEIRGKVSDSDILGIDINGSPFKVNSDSTFISHLHLHENLNQILITAVDFFGNVTKDTFFVTLDTTPPVLLRQSVPFLNASSATISWDTDEPSMGFISYGLSTGKEDTLRTNFPFSKSHTLCLTNLAPQSQYKYYIYGSDSLGNLGMWGPYDFLTKKANQLRISLRFNYFGDSTRLIDQVLVNFYADGHKVKVDTVRNGQANDFNLIFENQCKLNWEKNDSLSASSAIQMYDAALAALYSIGQRQLDSLQVVAADVDLNNQVLMYDAAQIARFAVGLPIKKSSHVGEWKFLPDSVVFANVSPSEYDCHVTGIVLGDVNGDWHPELHLPKHFNSRNDKWLKQNLSFNGDTLLIDIPFKGTDKNNHFSFFADVNYDKNDLKYLGHTENGSTRINIFQNVTQSNLKIGGFSTHQINENSIHLRFLNRSHRNFVDIKKLDIMIDNKQLILANNILVKRKTGVLTNTFVLFQNYPNPFNGNTHIPYMLPRHGLVTVIIFNQKGEVVKHVSRKEMPAGLHEVFWNGTNDLGQKTSSGLYLIRFIFGGEQKVSKLLYIK